MTPETRLTLPLEYETKLMEQFRQDYLQGNAPIMWNDIQIYLKTLEKYPGLYDYNMKIFDSRLILMSSKISLTWQGLRECDGGTLLDPWYTGHYTVFELEFSPKQNGEDWTKYEYAPSEIQGVILNEACNILLKIMRIVENRKVELGQSKRELKKEMIEIWSEKEKSC